MKNELSILLLSAFTKHKKSLLKLGFLLVILLIIFFTGRSSASEKYEDTVADLKQQVSDLEQQMEEAAITWEEQPAKEITIDLIESEIKDIGELVTIEYLYTDAGKFEDVKQAWGVNIPFTSKSFITKWDGVIKAGIDVEQILIEINETEKEILIHMPKAKILSHEIDDDSIEVLDEKDGLFNKVTVQNTVEFETESKQAMEQRAIENGILDKAFENAKHIIEKLVNNDVVQEQGYTITFEMVE